MLRIYLVATCEVVSINRLSRKVFTGFRRLVERLYYAELAERQRLAAKKEASIKELRIPPIARAACPRLRGLGRSPSRDA